MNKTTDYQFTVIVPVYNEADNISRLERRLAAFLPVARLKSCVLFVDDGSTDGSRGLIVDACRRNNDFYYIFFERNCGLSAAVKAGIDCARSPYVGYIDADLQTAPEDFNLLLEYAGSYELVMGIRAERKDSPFKRLQSRVANAFRRMMTHDGVEDTGCPLKVMRTANARLMPFFTGMHRFIPALMQLQECRVKQVPVRHFPRTAGKSKYHLRNRLIGTFVDSFAYRWMRKRYINYRITGGNLS